MPRILIVDDHPLYRMGLLAALGALVPDSEVLGVPSAEDGLALLEHDPGIDVVLLDERLPGMGGLAALAVYGDRHPEIPRVLISGLEDPGLGRRALEAGASGFIPKSLPADEVAAAIGRVLEGGVFAPAGDAGPILSTTLTLRQLEVLRLLGDGFTNKEIARALDITERTARAHVSAILEHFRAENRTQAVLSAQRAGLLTPYGSAA